MATDQLARAIGVFENQERAVDAFDALVKAGFSADRILILARDWHGRPLVGPRIDLQRASGRGALRGAIIGAVVGVVGGCLVTCYPRPWKRNC